MASGSTSFEASPQQCTEREGRQAAFRRLISDISEYLSPEEVAKFSFIQSIPERNVSALNALDYLMRKGKFSHDNLEPLVALLKDIKRHDLVTSLVDDYRKNFPNDICQSLPTASVTPKIPVKARANMMPSDLVTPPNDPHPNPVEETGNVTGYPPQEVMGHTGQSYTQPVAFVHHMDHVGAQPPPIDPGSLHPHTAPIIQPIAMQPLSGVYYSTQQQQQQEACQVPAPHMHNSQPTVYRTYTPVLVPVASHDAPHSAMTPQSVSASSSVLELQTYSSPSNEDLLISDLTSFPPPQPPPQQSSQEEVATTNCDSMAVKLKHQVHKGLPRANSYPRGMVHSIQQGNQFPGHGRSSMTTPPSQLLHMMSAGNRQQLRTQRALTPPATLGKHVSAPVFKFRSGSIIPVYDRDNLSASAKSAEMMEVVQSHSSDHIPATGDSVATLRSKLRRDMPELEQSRTPKASVYSKTSEGTIVSPRTSFYGKESIYDSDDPVSSARQSPQATKAVQKEKSLWRKLPFFKGKSRHSSNHSFTWKVVREDLMKPVWRHEESRCITRPHKLELDAGLGKHNPKLSFNLYPYGQFEDSGKCVTMAVRISTSEKCPPLPPTSQIHLSLVVWDGEREGAEVSRCHIAEKLNMSVFYVHGLITHDQLKESHSKHFHLDIEVSCTGVAVS